MQLGQHLGQHAGQQIGSPGAGAVVSARVAMGAIAGMTSAGRASLLRAAAIGAIAGMSVSGSIDPIAVMEDAIHAWVVAGSGLAADHVIWSIEGTSGGDGPPPPTPSGTYISLRIHDGDSVSDDWIVSEVVNGQVIDHMQGTFHPTLEITCYSGGRYGSSRAVLLLRRVLALAIAPDIAQILRLGRVGLGTYDKIRTIDGNRSTMFDPRVIVEVQLHLAIDVARPGRSIDTVEVDGAPLGSTLSVTRPA